ncbi:hypothetical protein Y697_08435 [Mesotoga sp. BH458_6_3_2_1]|nr:hypothetical protein Y697_08435 [Mesotoga sp. BH458_6_3_2_1]
MFGCWKDFASLESFVSYSLAETPLSNASLMLDSRGKKGTMISITFEEQCSLQWKMVCFTNGLKHRRIELAACIGVLFDPHTLQSGR